MMEREVKQLIRLLEKFRDNLNPEERLSARERGAIKAVLQLVKWYGHDGLGMDL